MATKAGAEKAAGMVALRLNPRAFMIDRHEAGDYVWDRRDNDVVLVPAAEVEELKAFKVRQFAEEMSVLVEATPTQTETALEESAAEQG